LPLGSVLLPAPAAGEALAAAYIPRAAGAGAAPPPRLLLAEAQALLERTARSGRSGWLTSSAPAARILAIPLALPPRLLLLGAGPDAAPIVEFAAQLAWKVTVFDHRPSYAQAAHFPRAERVVLGHPDELGRLLDLASFDAAVVMSHHLPSDLAYLRILGASAIAYLGLLGPALRRERLLADLGEHAARVGERLHAPVGLDLGGRSPESIALAIVAEIHAFLHGRAGAPCSRTPLAADASA